MGILSRIATYHRTRGGLLIFGLTELLLAAAIFAIGTALNATDPYLITVGLIILLLAGFTFNFVRLGVLVVQKRPSAAPWGQRPVVILAAVVIALGLWLPLAVVFTGVQGVPAFTIPTGNSCAVEGAGCLSCTSYFGLAYDTPVPSQGFPFYVIKPTQSDYCYPLNNDRARALDIAVAGIASVVLGAGVTLGALVVMKGLQRGRQAAAA